MAGWRFVADLVAGTWTRGAGTSVTLACRSMSWDLRNAAWDAELLGLAGLEPRQMPPVLPWTEPVGHLTAEAADRLGLRAGVPVAVAGHDHVVGALGAGVVEPGEALDSIGTAEALLLVTPGPALDDAVRAAGFSVGAHVVPGRWTLIGGLQTSGAFVDWFVRSIAGIASDREGNAALHDLVARARRRPSGIVARPTLRGVTAPEPDADARASFEGIGPDDGLAELALAVLEGTAYHVRWMADALERLASGPIRRTRLIGGGATNPHLVAIKAALARSPLEVVERPEAAAVGAALIGGVAAGLLDPSSVLARAVPSRPVAAPPDLRAAYDGVYRDRFLRR
jgi:xylulokinase